MNKGYSYRIRDRTRVTPIAMLLENFGVEYEFLRQRWEISEIITERPLSNRQIRRLERYGCWVFKGTPQDIWVYVNPNTGA